MADMSLYLECGLEGFDVFDITLDHFYSSFSECLRGRLGGIASYCSDFVRGVGKERVDY
jgi:hypothetical protein